MNSNTTPTDEVKPGYVRCKDGKIAKRTSVVFSLRSHPEDPAIFGASDGAIYRKLESGQMIRLGKQKLGKADRKKMKRDRQEQRNSVCAPAPL
jgi:hypothetical protein